MKYILIFQLFIITISAHNLNAPHIHIFGIFHIMDLVLLILGVVSISILHNRLKKREE